MQIPSGQTRHFLAVDSTQDALRKAILSGEDVEILYASLQTAGRGRKDRTWVSGKDDSLTVSLAFTAYANHQRPYLVGMAVALAAAEAFDLCLQWPNDLVENGKKIGGILVEMFPHEGRNIPVVGLGLNLNQREFPIVIAHRATSLYLNRGIETTPGDALDRLIEAIAEVPEPNSWEDLRERWMERDETAGKPFRLEDGLVGVAQSIHEDGSLSIRVNAEYRTVYAADAWF